MPLQNHPHPHTAADRDWQVGSAASVADAQAIGRHFAMPIGSPDAFRVTDIRDTPNPFDPGHASADFAGTGGPIGTMPNGDEDGADLRFPNLFYDEHGNLVTTDGAQNGHDADAGVQMGGVALVGGVLALRLALAFLRRLMGSVTRVTRAHWDALPGPMKTALAAIGIGIGVDLALDVPGIPGDSMILSGLGSEGDPLAHQTPHMVDGHLGAHIIGSWSANGVTFYRLSNGKLAVQNKHGRWKTWKPKKPIVLMPGGANNLRTLLKADRILNAQAKKIASMLNRRAPRTRKAPTSANKGVVILQKDGQSTIS